MTAIEKIAAEIEAGKHDGSLLALVDAVRKRLAQGGGATRWKVTLDGYEFTEESLSTGAVRLAQQIAGCTWHALDPRTDADHFAAVVIGHLVTSCGLTREEAEAKADAVPMGRIAEVLTEYEVEPGKD